MMSFVITLLLTIFTIASGQMSWDRINSHVSELSAKGSHVFAMTSTGQILELVNDAWAQISYAGIRYEGLAAGSDGSVFVLGPERGISRYNPSTKSWTPVTSAASPMNALLNAKDSNNFVTLTTTDGRVQKYSSGNWLGGITGNVATGGYVNRYIAIGTDDSIFKITQQGVLSKFDGSAFTTVTLDPNIGEPIQLDVHSATRVVVLDYTQTPFLYDGTTWTNLGGGFNCEKVTATATKVYCIDPHGCVRSLTI